MVTLQFPKPRKLKGGRAAKKARGGRLCKERLEILHKMRCSICGQYGVVVHHIHDGGEPPDDYKTIPLKYRFHQGDLGIHTLGRKEWEGQFGTLQSHLAETNALLIAMGRKDLVKP